MIESLNNQRIKQILKLEKKKERKEQYLVYGMHLVSEGIKHKQVKTIILNSPQILETLKKEIKFNLSNEIEIIYVSRENLKKFKAVATTPDIIAVCFNKQNKLSQGSILGLNNLSDPGNVGTLLRTAKSFGINNVVLDMKNVDLYNFKTIQAMQGVHFSMNIVKIDLFDFAQEYKNKIYTTFLNEEDEFFNTQKTIKKDMNMENEFLLILGNESLGIEPKFKQLEHCNIRLDIEYESLNVGVAGGIIMYELTKGENNKYEL